MGYVNGFHTQAREQNAHHRKSLETRRTLATELEQFDSRSCQIVNQWHIGSSFRLAYLTRQSLFASFAPRESRFEELRNSHRVGRKPSVVAAEEEKEMAKYLGGSLREDEFFDRGFYQLH